MTMSTTKSPMTSMVFGFLIAAIFGGLYMLSQNVILENITLIGYLFSAVVTSLYACSYVFSAIPGAIRKIVGVLLALILAICAIGSIADDIIPMLGLRLKHLPFTHIILTTANLALLWIIVMGLVLLMLFTACFLVRLIAQTPFIRSEFLKQFIYSSKEKLLAFGVMQTLSATLLSSAYILPKFNDPQNVKWLIYHWDYYSGISCLKNHSNPTQRVALFNGNQASVVTIKDGEYYFKTTHCDNRNLR